MTSPRPSTPVTHGFPRLERETRILRVVVVRGERLAKKDIFGASDPYVKIRLLRGRTPALGQIGSLVRTATVKKTLNPVWNTSFLFRVKSRSNALKFEVFDANRLTRDDFLGQAQLSLRETSIGTEFRADGPRIQEMEMDLKPRSRKSRVCGKLVIKLAYVDQEPSLLESPASASSLVDPASGSASGGQDDWEIINLEETVETPLPEGWEEREDANGRLYYVEHRTRRTQWDRPTSSVRSVSIGEFRREMLLHNLRHHISAENGVDEQNAEEDSIADPGSDFAVLTLEDVSVGQEQEENPLPDGWEKRPFNDRILFIDHNRKITTWNDPRVKPPRGPRGSTSGRNASRKSGSPMEEGSTKDPTDLSLGPLPDGWEIRFHEQSKRHFFIDHHTHSTQWEDPRQKTRAKPVKAIEYSRDYKRKYDYLRAQMRRPHGTPNKFDIPVKRRRIFEDSYNLIMSVPPHRTKVLKARMWVEFDKEKGLDYGGVAREWFYLLSKEMFNPYYGLFEYSASDNYTLQINPNSGKCNEEHIKYFKFIGRICGMAVFHGKLIDAFFVRPFYKMMLRKRITLADMEAVDTEYHNSLKWILENDPQCLDLAFQVEEELFGQVKGTELKPGGAKISVTEANKKEYVNLVIQWRFCQRVEKQMKAFLEGFHELVPFQLLKMFDEREIEYLLCGLGEIDLKDWRRHTAYKGGYSDQNPVIVWLWKAIESFDTELQHRLLQFITGTSRVPMNGFAELYGSNGPQKFCVEKTGSVTALPRAHTCFNRLDLPPYLSYHVLREKIRLAVENCEGFEGVD